MLSKMEWNQSVITLSGLHSIILFFSHLDAPRTKKYFVFTLNFVSSELVDVAKNSPDSGYPDGEHPNGGDPKAFYENLPFHGAPLKQVSLAPHFTNKGLLPF